MAPDRGRRPLSRTRFLSAPAQGILGVILARFHVLPAGWLLHDLIEDRRAREARLRSP